MKPDPFFSLGKRKLFDDPVTPPAQPEAPAVTSAPTPAPTPSSSPGWGVAFLVVAALVLVIGLAPKLLRKPIPMQEVSTPKASVYDRSWERKMQASIAALDSEIKAAKDAYSRQEAFAKSRTISREDDRKEAARLNQAVLDLEKKRAEVAAELEAHRTE